MMYTLIGIIAPVIAIASAIVGALYYNKRIKPQTTKAYTARVYTIIMMMMMIAIPMLTLTVYCGIIK